MLKIFKDLVLPILFIFYNWRWPELGLAHCCAPAPRYLILDYCRSFTTQGSRAQYSTTYLQISNSFSRLLVLILPSTHFIYFYPSHISFLIQSVLDYGRRFTTQRSQVQYSHHPRHSPHLSASFSLWSSSPSFSPSPSSPLSSSPPPPPLLFLQVAVYSRPLFFLLLPVHLLLLPPPLLRIPPLLHHRLDFRQSNRDNFSSHSNISAPLSCEGKWKMDHVSVTLFSQHWLKGQWNGTWSSINFWLIN
jgi:hypothetical protein